MASRISWRGAGFNGYGAAKLTDVASSTWGHRSLNGAVTMVGLEKGDEESAKKTELNDILLSWLYGGRIDIRDFSAIVKNGQAEQGGGQRWASGCCRRRRTAEFPITNAGLFLWAQLSQNPDLDHTFLCFTLKSASRSHRPEVLRCALCRSHRPRTRGCTRDCIPCSHSRSRSTTARTRGTRRSCRRRASGTSVPVGR